MAKAEQNSFTSKFRNYNLKKISLITLIVSLTISALIGIYVFIFGVFDDLEIRILLTTLAVGVFSLTSLCCAALFDKQDARNELRLFAFTGVLTSFIGFFATVILIWGAFDAELVWKSAFVFFVLSITIGHMSLLMLMSAPSYITKIARRATYLFIVIVSFMVLDLVLEISGNDKADMFYRTLGVFSILDVLGTIVTPLLNKVTKQ